VEKFLKVLDKAAIASTDHMTKQVRNRAEDAGWDKEVVQSTAVVYDGGKFSAKIEGPASDKGFVHEFGDQTSPPTAILRQYGNDPQAASDAFLSYLESEVKGML